jgi:hypothetical protein
VCQHTSKFFPATFRWASEEIAPLSLQNFFTEHGREVQVLAAAIVVLAAGWFSRRAQPRTIAGWTLSTYSAFIKILSLLFAAFMTAAVLFNGLSIFNDDWWVAPAFLLIAAASYLFVYEVFFSTLRWNEVEVQVRRYPFSPKVMKFHEIDSVKFHGTTESVTLRSQSGIKLWFPYGYRVGTSELFVQIFGDGKAEA